MSELQNLEGEVEVSDSTENVKPVWVVRRINLPCLQPIVSELQGVGEEEMGREPEGVLIQTVELSALKQEAAVEPLVPKVGEAVKRRWLCSDSCLDSSTPQT
jgi:hypothetical protein